MRLSKSFGASIALSDVSFEARPGMMYLVLGLNGAGKSTLFRILAGLLRPDSGMVDLGMDGSSLTSTIRLLDQDSSACPELSVLDNILLGHSEFGYWRTSKRGRQDARVILDAVGGAHIDLDGLLQGIGRADREMIAIARVMLQDPSVALFDEPAAALSAADTERVLQQLVAFARAGHAVMITSHRIDLAINHADEVLVLREGRVEFAGPRAALDLDGLNMTLHLQVPDSASTAATALDSRLRSVDETPALGIQFHLHDASNEGLAILQVEPGEISVLNCDSPLVADMLWDAVLKATIRTGTVVVDTTEAGHGAHPGDLVGHGVALVPGDRRSYGIFPDLTVTENVSLPRMPSSWLGLIDWPRAHKLAAAVLGDLKAQYASLGSPCSTLSGGNQQKVILARWLSKGFRTLVLHDPLQGLDAQSTGSILGALRKARDAGATVVVITTSGREYESVCNHMHSVGPAFGRA